MLIFGGVAVFLIVLSWHHPCHDVATASSWIFIPSTLSTWIPSIHCEPPIISLLTNTYQSQLTEHHKIPTARSHYTFLVDFMRSSLRLGGVCHCFACGFALGRNAETLIKLQKKTMGNFWEVPQGVFFLGRVKNPSKMTKDFHGIWMILEVKKGERGATGSTLPSWGPSLRFAWRVYS